MSDAPLTNDRLFPIAAVLAVDTIVTVLLVGSGLWLHIDTIGYWLNTIVLLGLNGYALVCTLMRMLK